MGGVCSELGVKMKDGWTPAKPPLKSSGVQIQHCVGVGSSNWVSKDLPCPVGAPRTTSEQRHLPGLPGHGQTQRWPHGRRGLTPLACFTAQEANPAVLECPPLPANLRIYFNLLTGPVCAEYLFTCKLRCS